MDVLSLQAELALDGGLEPFAQFGGAVHGQRGLPTVQQDLEMRTLAGLEGGAPLLEPPLHLLRVHALRLNSSVVLVKLRRPIEASTRARKSLVEVTQAEAFAPIYVRLAYQPN
jgi:hypothetical protein